MSARVGVDIGGTFTDVALEANGALFVAKVLTTHDAPERAILDGLDKVLATAGVGFGDLGLVIHGTTLATNALIERRGAKTALLTTEGFRDVIEMRTESRFEQYDINIELPPPLVSREHRHVAGGRISASGRELLPLDEDAVARFAELAATAYESVAVGFIHAYANPAHERRARDIITERAPHLAVSLSCEVSPQMREFERFNTVCANAFVKPLMASYLARLDEQLKAAGTTCPLVLMHSGGGLIGVEQAIEFPVRLLESGPAGGAIFAADLAMRHGLDRVLSFDMGGTTAKICLIEDGTPKTARTFEVARTTRFKKGSGMPISIPVIEMVEIGAGGGSIARVDTMRQIRVGPQSAGSEPGPAAYGRGGESPTVTDADLLLGLLDPEGFAGGTMTLDTAAAAAAMVRDVGEPLGMDAHTGAIGVKEVVDETMANAARVHAVENGKDLAAFTMIAFGGAAPLHAVRLAQKLGIGRLLVPVGAGVGSAIGFLRAPFAYEAVQGVHVRLSAYDQRALAAAFADLAVEAEKVVKAGAPGATLSRTHKAYMRYRGQGWEIPVDLPDPDLSHEALMELFEAAYVTLFGRALEGIDVEIMTLAVRVASPVPAVEAVAPRRLERAVTGETRREIYDAGAGRTLAAAVVARDVLGPGEGVTGPAIVTERETTTIVPEGAEAVAEDDGSLTITLGDAA
ncbi:hydantoinase/oxoprolinase family protein [Acuticoccus mangrovi]|uniref:Hydantoinase/oxoprolinase family protein n=1 Tax=Acuticoccus mangrovi TaxID=2796142 RepID=A0A934IK25_9HYPH|nr:hydantoinase/oxoprolinase family protein [Acuticoccus mangrovi]